MKKTLMTSLGMVALLLALSATPAFAVGTDGSFENGTAPGSFLTLPSFNNTDITGWTVDAGELDYIGSYWTASNGSRSLDMNGTSAGSISQTFPTVVGAKYDVSFDLSGNPDGGPSLKVLRVSATGASSQDFNYDTSVTGNDKVNMKWAPQTYSFTATTTSTTLTFASQITGAFGPALDNVSIVETLPVVIPACSGTSNFETSSLGSVNGQDGGWMVTGPFDQAVVNNTYGYPTFGCKSLRISDAVTSGSFGDQTFSPSTANEAGETDALNGGMSGGTRQSHFEAQFDLASTSLTLQPGMHMSVSPDRGDGARMSYLRFEDQADGVHVFFDDVQGTGNPANFVETEIATITRSPHAIKFSMNFVDGPSNDIVKIYIDGNLIHTGTSWENYYRFDSESNPTLVSNSRTVDSLLFRESGSPDLTHSGNGFLIDNYSLTSSTPVTPSSISGMKYNDLNRNGKKDANEPGLSGWVIRLLQDDVNDNDVLITTATTDANGNYTFTNVAPGTYEVRETHQKGWKRMSKNPKDIVITTGSVVTGVDFGNAQKQKKEKEDEDKDDNRDEQNGHYEAGHGKSNYEKEKDNKEHKRD